MSSEHHSGLAPLEFKMEQTDLGGTATATTTTARTSTSVL